MIRAKDFVKIYSADSLIKTLAEEIRTNAGPSIHLKGLSGSLDAVVCAAVYTLTRQDHLLILHDKEEAAYFHNDLQNLVGNREVLFFPSSYKRPYQFEEIENANILQRAEILNRINHKSTSGELIVTYPEALTEKVIHKRSLAKNTFSTKVGDEIDSRFLQDLLSSYDFEKADFVYEAGQFAIRGGIIDIYSYAHELPYRLELFGDEIESIRTFDPNSQLSIDKLKSVNIIPNVQTKLLEETRQSFLQFISPSTKIWVKDIQQMEDVLDQFFAKAQDNFETIIAESGNSKAVLEPADLFETGESLADHLKPFALIEFGNRFYSPESRSFSFDSEGQPSFNKDFELLARDLDEKQAMDFRTIIASDSHQQMERLITIIDELGPQIQFQDLEISLRAGFVDKSIKVTCYTDHQLFDRFHRYQNKNRYSKAKALTLKELQNLSPGDYVTHIDYGIGRFVGLDKVEVGSKQQEVLRLVYRDDDLLYVGIHSLHKISKYGGKDGVPPIMNKLGSPEWENKKKRVKKKVLDIATDLIGLYAKRKASPGFSFSEDSFLQAELESSFIFDDTPDQAKASQDVKVDMQAPHPMDRLVCGDVGFGKTEVAIRAAWKAVCDNKQVAVLVPTTILAMQHFHTFSDRLDNFPVGIEYLSRFKQTSEVKKIIKNTAVGKTDILIGTHRIVNKDIRFKDLGLLIIDEEQKFGVSVKERLKEIKVNVDTLTLTATPIPRTLHFSLMGARDLSVITTPPPNRQPVTTELHGFNQEKIRDAISFELRRGGQVFFVHNRIEDIEQVANIVFKLIPDARIGVAHGQMQGNRLEKTMVRFIEGEYDVLVSTNIIESGLDIPNANTIIINHAHMFGLSDLHQMRGRVGRSNKKAFCYLLAPPTIGLTSEARKRLQTLEEFSELGDGFKVAMRDLDIRGAGNLLGREQSGFISDLGFDAYHKILDETITELKETEFKDLFQKDLLFRIRPLVADCIIETDLEIIIPEEYVSNISERLSLYSQIDNLKDQKELTQFAESLKDRFGPMPSFVEDLLETVKIRWIAERLGFEKLTMKNEALKANFVSSQNENYFNSEIFGKILTFVQLHPSGMRMKEVKGKLILYIEGISTVHQALEVIERIEGKVNVNS